MPGPATASSITKRAAGHGRIVPQIAMERAHKCAREIETQARSTRRPSGKAGKACRWSAMPGPVSVTRIDTCGPLTRHAVISMRLHGRAFQRPLGYSW